MVICKYEKSAEVEGRKVLDHWEGDLIMGKNHKIALGTLVEKTTRYVFIVPLKGKKSKDIREAFT